MPASRPLVHMLIVAPVGCFSPTGGTTETATSTTAPAPASTTTGPIDPTSDAPTTTATTSDAPTTTATTLPATSVDPTTDASATTTTTDGTTTPTATTTGEASTSTGPDPTVPGPACGDGVLDPGEQCEDGNLVGNDGCSATCTRDAYFVFVSSQSYAADLFQNYSGADALCIALGWNVEVVQTPVPSQYFAWISDGTSNAIDRIGSTNLPYLRTDGLPVADNSLALASARDLHNPISVDETGATVIGMPACNPGGTSVWTGTTDAGVNSGVNCGGWADNTPQMTGTVGHAHQVGAGWTDTAAPCGCDSTLRIYCVEHPG